MSMGQRSHHLLVSDRRGARGLAGARRAFLQKDRSGDAGRAGGALRMRVASGENAVGPRFPPGLGDRRRSSFQPLARKIGD